MADSRFSISESLKYGWKAFTARAGFFIGFFIVITLIMVVPDYLVDRLFGRGALFFVAKLVVRILGVVLGMATTRVALDIYDRGEPDTSRFGALVPQILPYLGGKILYGIIVALGMILLIVPGIIAALMFFYVGFLIVDRGIGPIDALKESKRVTDGSKWDLFLFSLVTALVNILGAVCLLVGLFVTIPVTLMASAYVYRQLSPAQNRAA